MSCKSCEGCFSTVSGCSSDTTQDANLTSLIEVVEEQIDLLTYPTEVTEGNLLQLKMELIQIVSLLSKGHSCYRVLYQLAVDIIDDSPNSQANGRDPLLNLSELKKLLKLSIKHQLLSPAPKDLTTELLFSWSLEYSRSCRQLLAILTQVEEDDKESRLALKPSSLSFSGLREYVNDHAELYEMVNNVTIKNRVI